MHCIKTEFKKTADGWLAVDTLVQPQGDRCMVLMDPPKTHTDGGLEIPDEHQEVCWEGVVVAAGNDCKYGINARVVVGKHAGIQEYHPGTKRFYVIATSDEVIHVVERVTRAVTAEEKASLTSEADATARLAAARKELLAGLNKDTQDAIRLG